MLALHDTDICLNGPKHTQFCCTGAMINKAQTDHSILFRRHGMESPFHRFEQPTLSFVIRKDRQGHLPPSYRNSSLRNPNINSDASILKVRRIPPGHLPIYHPKLVGGVENQISWGYILVSEHERMRIAEVVYTSGCSRNNQSMVEPSHQLSIRLERACTVGRKPDSLATSAAKRPRNHPTGYAAQLAEISSQLR